MTQTTHVAWLHTARGERLQALCYCMAVNHKFTWPHYICTAHTHRPVRGQSVTIIHTHTQTATHTPTATRTIRRHASRTARQHTHTTRRHQHAQRDGYRRLLIALTLSRCLPTATCNGLLADALPSGGLRVVGCGVEWAYYCTPICKLHREVR